ncbi:MAG: alpha/beta hydrolase, partial [Schleiferilactobacillus harbinensis]
MQKRTKLLIVSLSAVIIVLALGGIWFRQRSAGQVQYARTTTPTLFLHGWGSSYHAEEHMTNAAK